MRGWKEPIVVEEYGPDRIILKLSFLKKVAIKVAIKKWRLNIYRLLPLSVL